MDVIPSFFFFLFFFNYTLFLGMLDHSSRQKQTPDSKATSFERVQRSFQERLCMLVRANAIDYPDYCYISYDIAGTYTHTIISVMLCLYISTIILHRDRVLIIYNYV